MLKKTRQRRSRIAQKTLGAHRLAPVHKLDVHYSARREPRCGRTADRRVLARRGRAGENNGLFEHPAGTSIGTTVNPTFPNEWVQNSFPTAC